MAHAQAEQRAKRERWNGLLDASGELVPFDPALFSKKRLEQLGITPTKFKKSYNSVRGRPGKGRMENGLCRAACRHADHGGTGRRGMARNGILAG